MKKPTAFTSLDLLSQFLQLNDAQKARLTSIPRFPLLLPYRLAEKIKKGTLEDPILKQFVPIDQELMAHPMFGPDPVGDRAACQTGKLLKKYEGRALLITSAACAMNCRFCFRRAFDYQTTSSFDKEFLLIAQDPTITEVILSGGDPLSLSNPSLKKIIEHLEAIPHLKRLRWHTRFPIGYPDRIDKALLEMISNTRLQSWFVLHINHPNELDEELLHRIKTLPCPVLTQTVLLKGVNNEISVLKKLFEMLVDHGIMPYYLHQLDRVEGAQHFEATEHEGQMLIKELASLLSGYAVPRYVKEIAGALHKTSIL